MTVLLNRTEVAFANAGPLDVVHVAANLGKRSFVPLCAPETTFHGDLAETIPPDRKRCESCARKANKLWSLPNKSASDAHTAANR